jgi:TolB-like protein/class 3 adenylate cyclase
VAVQPVERTERRLAAVLAADAVGYSRLMGDDEEGTLAALRAIRRDVTDRLIAEHRGRIVKTTGDGLLVEFPSVVDSVRCAVKIQEVLSERNKDHAPAQRIEFRIGINLGDIIVEDGDIFGDGVNVAARLEGLAEPGSIYVSRVVRDQVHDKVEFRFEDLGDRQVKNIKRAIRVFAVRVDTVIEKEPAAGSELALPDKPSIAVLPFQNMSGDPEQEYFADGMVEEIITALSRIGWLFVIARNSSFTYKGQAVDVKQVGRELGVRYVLEGSVRKAGNRVRITAQLIEAETHTHLWADRFEGGLDDIFELQDHVAVSVAGVIEPTLRAAETARSVRRPTTDLTAYDQYLRAYAVFLSSTERVPEALSLLEQVIARDPHYGPALALAALCCQRLLFGSHVPDRQTYFIRGTELARRALVVAGDDPVILANAAGALAYFGEDISATTALLDRALALNPNYARGWFLSGMLRMWAGHPETTIDYVSKAQRLSPRGQVGSCNHLIGAAHLVLGQFEEALPRLLLAVQEDPSFPNSRRFLAACYAHMGRIDEAREVVEQLRTLTLDVMPDSRYLRNEEQREVLLSGLRLAMGTDA